VTDEPEDAGSPASISIQRRIEWSDTDASGRWHNTAAFRVFEWAETAMFESLGILDDVYGRLPRAHIAADFKALLDHRDLIDVELKVAEVGRSSLAYAIVIRRDSEIVVEARVVTVLVDPQGRPEAWPDEYRRLLLTAGEQPREVLVTGAPGKANPVG
jgi:acyl-CoA thioesterase FadM